MSVCPSVGPFAKHHLLTEHILAYLILFPLQDEENNKQIAGFVTEYEGISFMTVKGAGHMVPSDKPRQALKMFKQFLSGGTY